MAYNADYLGGPVYVGGAAGMKIWSYTTADDSATIVGTGYFADAGAGTQTNHRGMEVGDIVLATKVTTLPNTTPLGVTLYVVSAIDADGDATVIATAIA